MSQINQLRKELKLKASAQKAQVFRSFFKTGPGEYGEGDVFFGITVPDIRNAIKNHTDLEIEELAELLHSKIHEERLAALLIMVAKFENGQAEDMYNLYIKNTGHINNWDLVDLSVYKIMGAYLSDKPKTILYKFAESPSVWERRMAIIATFEFIRNNKFEETLKIAKMLLKDGHDLIHKAVGWMLREAGKRNLKAEEDFLNQYAKIMPRTMLRYALEKFPQAKKKRYLGLTH
jgi:3-methyladenine DNA glycosylase AlkD